MSFLDLARERYSERRFSDAPIEREKLERILGAGRVAPTAENFQPQRILVVQSPEGLEKVDKGTRCRFGAPCVLVLAYDMTESAHNADVVDYGVVDVTIAGTQMSLAAQELGIHSCWVGLIDPPTLRRELGIPATHRIVALMPLGYPSERSRPSYLHRRRKPLEQTTFFETYGAPGPKTDDEGRPRDLRPQARAGERSASRHGSRRRAQTAQIAYS